MRNPFVIYTGSEVRILTTVNIHRSWRRRVQCFGAALLAMSMLAGCGISQTAKQAESESTEENLVLMEETLPQTAADETVMALSPDGPLLPSVEGVDAEYSEPIPDYLRIGEKHPIVLKLQQRLMDLGFMDNDEPTDYFGQVTLSWHRTVSSVRIPWRRFFPRMPSIMQPRRAMRVPILPVSRAVCMSLAIWPATAR